jgi:hypothetical protein
MQQIRTLFQLTFSLSASARCARSTRRLPGLRRCRERGGRWCRGDGLSGPQMRAAPSLMETSWSFRPACAKRRRLQPPSAVACPARSRIWVRRLRQVQAPLPIARKRGPLAAHEPVLVPRTGLRRGQCRLAESALHIALQQLWTPCWRKQGRGRRSGELNHTTGPGRRMPGVESGGAGPIRWRGRS